MRTTLTRLLRAVLVSLGVLALVAAATGVAGATQADEADQAQQGNPTEAGDAGEAEESENTEEPTDETQEIEAQALENHECDENEWHFVITQVEDESLAPEEIAVQFSGAEVTVSFDGEFTGGTAHYRLSDHLDDTVEGATANIYADWSGTFVLSHGPCDNEAQEGETPEEGADEELPEEEEQAPEEDEQAPEEDDEVAAEDDEVIVEDDESVAVEGDDEVAPEQEEEVIVADEGDDQSDEQVLSDQGEDAEVTDDETVVLGSQAERTALPRTGPSATVGLAGLGALMLLAGFGLERIGARLRAHA